MLTDRSVTPQTIILYQTRRAFWFGTGALAALIPTIAVYDRATESRDLVLIALVAEILALLGVMAWLAVRAREQTHEVMSQQERLENAEHTAAQAKARQQESESLLEFALNESPVGVSLRDSDLRMVRVNRSMVSMLGLGSEDPRGKTIEELVHDEIADVLVPAMKRVLVTGLPLTNISLHGSTRAEPSSHRHFIGSFFPILLPGKQKGVGTVLIDATPGGDLEIQRALPHNVNKARRRMTPVAQATEKAS